jgi:hypothetical protein
VCFAEFLESTVVTMLGEAKAGTAAVSIFHPANFLRRGLLVGPSENWQPVAGTRPLADVAVH